MGSGPWIWVANGAMFGFGGRDAEAMRGGQNCAHLVQDHGLVGEVHERLGHAKSERPQPGAEPTDENQGLHGVGECAEPNRIPDSGYRLLRDDSQ
jgi:hypothetical protein